MKAKRLVAAVVAIALLAGAAIAGDKYKKPVVVKEIGFSAKYEAGKVFFAWKKYLRTDLKYYKIVKSKTNAEPVYPEDGYIFYDTDANVKSWVEENPEPGKWYYRICIITNGGERWVSPVIALDIPDAGSNVPTAKDFAP